MSKLDIEIKKFLNKEQADWAWKHFIQQTDWQQDVYHFGGRDVLAPRLTALYGSESYVYSGITKAAKPLTEPLQRLLNKVQTETLIPYNSVLLNLYRNGRDSISFHSDDEPELGENPVISSLSLGEQRILIFKHNQTGEIVKIPLNHGDYLQMGSSVQPNWKHGINKCNSTGARVSLTFRSLV